jgi:hypothetical protein
MGATSSCEQVFIDRAAAEGTYQLADLMLRSRRSDRETQAMTLFGEVFAQHPTSPYAPQALARKAALEERERTRVVDAQVGTSVPVALVTYRTLVEYYPSAPAAEAALDRLAEFYDDLKRYELAAQALDALVQHFPNSTRDAAWRAGELYERRLKDPAKAGRLRRAIPADHRIGDAQKKLGASRPPDGLKRENRNSMPGRVQNSVGFNELREPTRNKTGVTDVTRKRSGGGVSAGGLSALAGAVTTGSAAAPILGPIVGLDGEGPRRQFRHVAGAARHRLDEVGRATRGSGAGLGGCRHGHRRHGLQVRPVHQSARRAPAARQRGYVTVRRRTRDDRSIQQAAYGVEIGEEYESNAVHPSIIATLRVRRREAAC